MFRRSPEEIAEIAQLWHAGKSAREIGEILGVTRNVVIGLVHRNHIKRDAATEAAHKVRMDEAKAERLSEARRLQAEKRALEKPKVVPIKQPATTIEATDFWRGSFSAQSLSPAGPKQLMDLTWSDCRFPLGKFNEAPTGFCAAPKKFGSSYCAAHHQLVYRGTVAEIDAKRRAEEKRRRAKREARQAVAS